MYTYVDSNNEEILVPYKTSGMVYYNGKYYDNMHPDIVSCRHCGKKYHKNYTYNRKCFACHKKHREVLSANLILCPICNKVHYKTDMCGFDNLKQILEYKGVTYGESKRISIETRQFYSKGDAVLKQETVDNLPFQEERILPDGIVKTLRNFYKTITPFTKYYYRGDYNIEGDVNFINTSKFNDIIYNHNDCRMSEGDIKYGYKLSPYRNYTLIGITKEGQLQRSKYDLLGNVKTWTEKPNKFIQSMGRDISNEDVIMNVHYKLSNDLNHKLLAFNKNPSFGSCQKSCNAGSYALGAYDAITNGCNCPILLYKEGQNEPFGRITCRLMYDKSGKEYLLLERLYHDGTLGCNSIRGSVYGMIAKSLKDKGYTVIASNYSAHDNSTYTYLAGLGLYTEDKVLDLIQPLRRLWNGYGYYCDGGTNVYKGTINGLTRATDYLDKAFII